MDEKDDLLELRALLEKERHAIARIRQIQRVWWIAVFLLGLTCGFALCEWITNPVTIIVPDGSGIKV